MQKVRVIESDDALRALFEEWLVQAGHEVLAAEAPVAADVVLLDLPDLYANTQTRRQVQAARARSPGAALILLSTQLTRSLGADSALARELGVHALLAKPCTRLDLLAAVSACRSDSAAPPP